MVPSRLIGPLMVLPLFPACSDDSAGPLAAELKEAPVEIYRFCQSESGQSRYFVHLELIAQRGVLRYQYMGQDIRYQVSQLQSQNGVIRGVGRFESAATGEVRGNPIRFEFDFISDRLQDGSTRYRCGPLQDVTLIEFPA